MHKNSSLNRILFVLLLGLTSVLIGCLEAIFVPEADTISETTPTTLFGVPPPFSRDKDRAQPVVQLQTDKESDPEKVKKGEALFTQWCSGCHNIKTKEDRIGPSLKNLFKQEALPISLKPATWQNVRAQISTPYRYMPRFPNLSEEEVEQIIEFLKTI